MKMFVAKTNCAGGPTRRLYSDLNSALHQRFFLLLPRLQSLQLGAPSSWFSFSSPIMAWSWAAMTLHDHATPARGKLPILHLPDCPQLPG